MTIVCSSRACIPIFLKLDLRFGIVLMSRIFPPEFKSLPHIFNMFSGLSEDINTTLILIILQAVQYYANGQYDKIPCRTSKLRGAEYVSEVIMQNHLRHIQEVFCMPLSTLLKLERFFFATHRITQFLIC